MKMNNEKKQLKELNQEAAIIRKKLKIKGLSKYTQKRLKQRHEEILDMLCGFTELK